MLREEVEKWAAGYMTVSYGAGLAGVRIVASVWASVGFGAVGVVLEEERAAELQGG
jgi:hypothetical protein